MKLPKNNLALLITGIVLIGSVSSCSSINHPEYWMTQNKSKIIDRHISDIKIPGSYRANAYNITGKESICLGETNQDNSSSLHTIAQVMTNQNEPSSGGITQFIKYLNHQNTNIFTQLSDGMRYLDISICYQNNTFYTSDYYLTDSLAKISEQVNKFINKHPYELIILDLDNVWDQNGEINDQNAKSLIAQLQNEFGSRIIPNNKTPLTFRNIWKDKQNILIMSNHINLYQSDIIWNKAQLVNLDIEPEFATIKKLTNMQLGITELESTNAAKLNIFPVYTKFNLTQNSVDEINYFHFNSNLIIDYLYSLPESNPINIIVADKYFKNDIANYSMNQFKVENKSFKKPKYQNPTKENNN